MENKTNFKKIAENHLKNLNNEEATKEEMFLAYAEMDLKGIKKWAEEIAGEWNGDEAGSQEERAGQANEIIEKVDELIELIGGMENL
jgi:hypothetical protein